MISMKRLNITLPERLVQRMKKIPNKSRFIAEAVEEKLKKIRKEELNVVLIKGYLATRNEDKKIDKEWKKITLEDWK